MIFIYPKRGIIITIYIKNNNIFFKRDKAKHNTLVFALPTKCEGIYFISYFHY